MANTLLTPSIIAKEALYQLNANCVMAGLVHREYSKEFQKVGDTITIRKPATFETKEFKDAIVVQDATEQGMTLTIDHHADVSFSVTSKDLALTVQDFSAQFLEPAMKAFAQKVDSDLTALYADIPYYVAQNATPSLKDISACRAVLGNNKVPFGNRSLVMNPDTEADYNTLPAIVNAEKSGTTAALREAAMGKVLGFDTYVDQNVATATKGTLGTAKVKAEVAIGATTLTAYNATLTGDLKKGDIFTVAGSDTKYVVTGAVTASSNEAVVAFYPATTAVISADSVITVADGGIQNMAFYRNAFTLVTCPLELPLGSSNASITTYNGYGLRVVKDYDITHKKDVISIDMIYGVKTLTPEMACRLIKA